MENVNVLESALMKLEFAAESSRHGHSPRHPVEVIGGTIAHSWPIEFGEENAQTVKDREGYMEPQPALFPHFEVFSVIIKFATKIPPNLHGTITVFDAEGELDLYTRKKSNCKPIHPGIDLLLTGPHRNIVADNQFCILVTLEEEDDNRGCKPFPAFRWDPLVSSHAYYNLPLSTTLKCPFGSVTLNWSMFGYAVGAHVEVILLRINNVDDDDGENENLPAADICGSITAGNSMFKDHIQIVLFRKTTDDKGHICLRPGVPIPLSRSVVAVPHASSLIVHLDLWDAHHRVSIAKDSVEFPNQSKGTSKKNISSSYGDIQVKLTWERSE